MRRRRGFVQFAILNLLKEESMHGYQIMKELEERSGGAYSASAGTIYPALQELVERSLIELEEGTDKKVYHITVDGKKRLEEFAPAQHEEKDFWVEWKERMVWRNSVESIQLRAALDQWEKELRKAIKHIRGNPENVLELIAFVDEMTDRIKTFSNKQRNNHE